MEKGQHEGHRDIATDVKFSGSRAYENQWNNNAQVFINLSAHTKRLTQHNNWKETINTVVLIQNYTYIYIAI